MIDALFGSRIANLVSPFGEGVLMLDRLDGTESLGRVFEYHLDLIAPTDNLSYRKILGESITVELETEAEPRFINGVVTSFSYAGFDGRHARYTAVIQPWLALLGKTSSSRIFQRVSVPEVIKRVFRDRGFSDFEERLNSTYQPWEYLTQYRESDLNFVSRLMEQEGIYYFFEHTAGKHTMILADSYSAHHSVAGYDNVSFFPEDANARRDREHVNAWNVSHRITAGTYATGDFNFEKPRTTLTAKSSNPHEYSHADAEVYDFPGEYEDYSEGEGYARIRLEELQSDHLVASGSANVRGLLPGHLFQLEGHPRADQNAEYLVTSTTIHLENNLPENDGRVASRAYTCSFQAINSKSPFRNSCTTPKPTVPGPQTAIVVGKAGEEIWTDQYGRVKVHFHWDREGNRDENSSCWIRVAQVWAGAGWGAIHVPRIGHEVIVEFLEGDPDRPIITGRVYNGANMPPHDLGTHATRSGIKSHSTKGGGVENFNELRFEDKKGEEQVYLHAEKDLEAVVENDEKRSVGRDRVTDVGRDETVTVGGNRTENVKKDETITIEGNRTESVTKNETISIEGNRTESVAKNETISVEGSRSTTVSKDDTLTVKGNRTHSVSKDEKVTVEGGRTTSVTKDELVSVSGARTQVIEKNDSLKVSKKILIDGGEEVVIKTGSASITMKKDGTITIKGKDITLDGAGKINAKASGDVILKGSKVTQN